MDFTRIYLAFVAGLVATGGMALIEYSTWRRSGMEGVSEWQLNQSLMARLLHRPPQFLVMQGLLLHFLNGGIAGIVFAVLFSLLPPGFSSVFAGIGFGLALWIFSVAIMKPIICIQPQDHSNEWFSLILDLFAHLMYGGILGLLLSVL